MKWFKSISLTLLILISNSGIAANYHWCAGELMEASISWGTEKLSCGMSEMDTCPIPSTPSEEDTISNQSCCDHSSHILSVDDELRKSDVSIDNITLHFIIAFATSITPTHSQKEVFGYDISHHPPPHRIPFYIIHCSYLI